MLLAVLLALARFALVPWVGDRAPFAFVFVSVVAAAVLAGWRSGLVALLLGQALAWFLVVQPSWSFTAKDPESVASLVLATVSELIALAVIGLYQREVDRAWSVRENQMELLEKALREIDHRTSNNYQTVLALILAQAKTSEGAVRDALAQVADRIRAIANAQRKLALASINLEQVMIAEHLQELCASLRQGLARPGVELNCDFAERPLAANQTVCISILVNELVTNALKHAFPEGRTGTIEVTLRDSGQALELVVADDGVGIGRSGRSQGTGLGARLVDTFVRQLKARHEVQSDDGGTRHRIRIPA